MYPSAMPLVLVVVAFISTGGGTLQDLTLPTTYWWTKLWDVYLDLLMVFHVLVKGALSSYKHLETAKECTLPIHKVQ